MFDSLYFREHRARQHWNSEMSFYPKAREAGSCFIDVNSFLRNGVSTTSALTPLRFAATLFVAASAVAGGVVGVPIGLAIVRNGCKQMKAAAQVGDIEGLAHNGLWTGVGATFAGLSGLLATNGVMSLAGKVPPAPITPAFGGACIAMYGAILAYGVHGLWKTSQFHSELKTVLKERGESGVLDWLKDQVTLNEKEAKDPEKAKILQKKWNRFELRTNAACAALVREKLSGLMTPNETSELIQEIEKAVFKERVKYFLLILIALLGIAGALCIILLAGPASPLLFALGGLAWLTVDNARLHSYIGDQWWAWYSKKEPEAEEEQIACLAKVS